MIRTPLLPGVVFLVLIATAPACRGTETPSETSATAWSGPTGFDEPLDEPSWRFQDAVSFRLLLERGDVRKEWGLTFACQALTEGGSATLTFTNPSGEEKQILYDEGVLLLTTVRENGSRGLASTSVGIPRTLLENGLYPACSQINDTPPSERRRLLGVDPRTLEASALEAQNRFVEALVSGLATFQNVMQILQDDPELSEVLWAVIEKPSFFSLVTTLGRINTTTSADWAEVRTTEFQAGDTTLPAWFLPLTISVNGQEALEADLTVVRPLPPYHVAGGLARMVGRSPERDDVRVVLTLEAARLGKQPF